MTRKKVGSLRAVGTGGKEPHRLRELLHRLLAHASRDSSRLQFLGQACDILLEFSGCDAVEVRVEEAGKTHVSRVLGHAEEGPITECWTVPAGGVEGGAPGGDRGPIPEGLVVAVLEGHFTAAAPFLTRGGSFWTGDTASPILVRESAAHGQRGQEPRTIVVGGEFLSLSLIPIPLDGPARGVLFLGSRQRDFFRKEDVQLYEAVAETLGVALAHRDAQWALRERVKELTCLYGIAKLTQQAERPLEEVLAGIAGLLPPAWQYPEAAHARIVLDDRTVTSAGFREGDQRMGSEILAKDRSRGRVEIVYAREMPLADEGPFLAEERALVDEVARQIGLLRERREAAEERSRLEQQLLRADRLATIGQLSAGIAHELNEPLGATLGFAQLAKSFPGLPAEVVRDMEKIEGASLHAREVIRKLLVFARVVPSRKAPLDLNRLVQEELYLLESRCRKEGIRLERKLSPGLPPLLADRSQIHQVLVNLVVNAIQAMPSGGRLLIETGVEGGQILLIVEDGGCGMEEAVLKQVFVPFFTTKEPGKGTGLGLSVVHGIVSSHGGTIAVSSAPGRGSRFEVRFPLSPPATEEVV